MWTVHRRNLRWTFPPEPSESEREAAVPLPSTDATDVEGTPSTEPAKHDAPAESVGDESKITQGPEPEPSQGSPLVDPPRTARPAPASPHPRRTRFAVSLQVGRGFSDLVTLVRASAEERPNVVRTSSNSLARHILRGARDRSRDRHLRPLLDHQRRTQSLREPRPLRRRPPSVKSKKRPRRELTPTGTAGVHPPTVMNLANTNVDLS